MPENLTLSTSGPSSMKMLGITSTVFCVLPALVPLGLFGTCYLDGTQAISAAVNSFKMVDVVHLNNGVAVANVGYAKRCVMSHKSTGYFPLTDVP